jgi:hypothetical protein
MMEEGALRNGNGGGRGDGSDTTGAFLGHRAGGIERCRAGDVDSDKAKLIVSLAEFREIKEAWDTMGNDSLDRFGSDEMACIVHIPGWKTIHGNWFGFA